MKLDVPVEKLAWRSLFHVVFYQSHHEHDMVNDFSGTSKFVHVYVHSFFSFSLLWAPNHNEKQKRDPYDPGIDNSMKDFDLR